MNFSRFVAIGAIALGGCASPEIDGKRTAWDNVKHVQDSRDTYSIRVRSGGFLPNPARLHQLMVTRAQEVARANGKTGFVLSAPMVSGRFDLGYEAISTVTLVDSQPMASALSKYYNVELVGTNVREISESELKRYPVISHGKTTIGGPGSLLLSPLYFDGANAPSLSFPVAYYVNPGDQIVVGLATYRTTNFGNSYQASIPFRLNPQPGRRYFLSGHLSADYIEAWIEDETGARIEETRVRR